MRHVGVFLPIFLVLSATANAADVPIRVLDGKYEGVFAAPPAPGCGINAPMNEPMTFFISTKGEAVRIKWVSPFGSRLEFAAPLVRSGDGWALAGRYTASNKLGAGTFTGRLIAAAHGVIFIHQFRSATAPGCIGEGTMAGTKPF